MPQLYLGGRRWRVATDTLPLLSGFLAVVHFALLVPLITVTLITRNSDYDCNKKSWVQGSSLGIMYTYGVSVLVEVAITVVGMRGGPLEERKRRWMRALIDLEIFLWVAALAFTIFGTITAASPDVEATCWGDSPCVGEAEYIPSVCIPDGTGAYTLSPPCAVIKNNTVAAAACSNKWMDYAAGYMVENFNASHRPRPFNLAPDPSVRPCPQPVNWLAHAFHAWRTDHPAIANQSEFLQPYVSGQNNASALARSRVLDVIGVDYSNTSTPAQSAPWWPCFGGDPECQVLLVASGKCRQWNVLLRSDTEGISRKHAFEASVYGSWAVLAVTVAVVWGAFSAVPDYESSDSWESTVKTLGRVCCCTGELSAETQDGQAASKEIGNLLHVLFGAVDLDATDQLLGIYLVSERQRARREQHVLKALAAAGIAPPAPPPRGKLGDGLRRLRQSLRRQTAALPGMSGRRSAPVRLTNTVDAPIELMDMHTPGGSLERSSVAVAAANGGDKREGAASPGVVDDTAPRPRAPKYGQWRSPAQQQSGHNGEHEDGAACVRYVPPDLASSFVRLVSVRPTRLGGRGRLGSLAFSDGASASGNVEKSALSTALSQPQPGLLLEVVARPQPLLTPVSLRRFNLPIPAREAARIYMHGDGRAVSKAELEEALAISHFAGAAYGLQNAYWHGLGAYTEHNESCAARVDSALVRFCCISNPLDVQSRFRKRNMSAILGVTGIAPADLLYVSYANATFGILPYMLLLHRPSRSVVLAVRGTASTTDLLTDLLSNPVDAADEKWMPEWVRKAVPAEELYAHSGILSSTAAVLKDLEEHGLLQQMAEARLSGGKAAQQAVPAQEEGMQRARTQADEDEARHLERLASLSEDEEIVLPLQRAQTMIKDKVVDEGWRVVVTGHSLGAAVASMLSFHLRARFPDLQCFAFCSPGGLVSPRLSELARPFCTSVANGCDIISRLGFPTTKRVVDDMVAALARCKRPKLKVGADIVLGRREDVLTAPPTFCSFEDIGPEGLAVLEHYCATSKLHAATADLRELFPAGRIMHLRPYDREAPPGMKPSKAKALPEVWDAAWISPRALIAEGMLLSSSMVRHHFMYTVQDALRSAIAGEADVSPAGDEAA